MKSLKIKHAKEKRMKYTITAFFIVTDIYMCWKCMTQPKKEIYIEQFLTANMPSLSFLLFTFKAKQVLGGKYKLCASNRVFVVSPTKLACFEGIFGEYPRRER